MRTRIVNNRNEHTVSQPAWEPPADKYADALALAVVFIPAATLALLAWLAGTGRPDPISNPPAANVSYWGWGFSTDDILPLLVFLVSAFTALISAIGSISAVIIAWRSDKRSSKELELKIAQLQLQLEEAKRREENEAAKTLPAPVTTRKKRSRKPQKSQSALLVKNHGEEE